MLIQCIIDRMVVKSLSQSVEHRDVADLGLLRRPLVDLGIERISLK